MPHKPSMRVSLNPQFLNYDPVCDSGINVGYNNREQTVGPGAKWYRDDSTVRAFHEEEAVITAPGVEKFRECVLMIQNGIRMFNQDGNLVKTTASEEGEEPDAEYRLYHSWK